MEILSYAFPSKIINFHFPSLPCIKHMCTLKKYKFTLLYCAQSEEKIQTIKMLPLWEYPLNIILTLFRILALVKCKLRTLYSFFLMILHKKICNLMDPNCNCILCIYYCIYFYTLLSKITVTNSRRNLLFANSRKIIGGNYSAQQQYFHYNKPFQVPFNPFPRYNSSCTPFTWLRLTRSSSTCTQHR